MAGQVSRLPVDPGQSGWLEVLGDVPHSEPLSDARTSDWLVIGAGFAGLAAARRLSQLCPSDRIVVLDAKKVGEGPAGRNSGFMIDLPHDLSSADYGGALEADKFQTEDHRYAIKFAAEMASEFDLSEEAFSILGKVNGAASPTGERHNETYAKHLTAMGEAHEWLDAAAMRALTGSTYYRNGLRTPGCAIIQPAMFVRGVAAGLRSNRVTIFEDSPVTALSRDGDWIAETPKGRVTAPKVILAVNGHLESFGHMRGRLIHLHTYSSMTRALDAEEVKRLGGEADWGITSADPMGTSVRRISGTGGDRILVRNRFTFDPSLEVGPDRLNDVSRDHDRAFAARFPMLNSVSMEYRWGGRLCLSQNAVQVIFEQEQGLFLACCQNGLGTVKGTLAGMMAAEMATGTTSDRLGRLSGADLPRKLPPMPFTKIGAIARLRYGEWKAGREL